MQLKIGLLIVPLAALLLGAAAPDRESFLAQRREQLRQKWEQQFRAADTNQDRLLSREEGQAAKLPPALLDRFGEIDTNQDQQLSPEELMAVYEKRLDQQRERRTPRR